MFFSALRRGKHFGNLGKIYGQYRFALAPSEQKVWKNFWNEAVVKVVKYYGREYWYVLPMFSTLPIVKYWADKKHEELYRKNPADFANDE